MNLSRYVEAYHYIWSNVHYCVPSIVLIDCSQRLCMKYGLMALNKYAYYYYYYYYYYYFICHKKARTKNSNNNNNNNDNNNKFYYYYYYYEQLYKYLVNCFTHQKNHPVSN